MRGRQGDGGTRGMTRCARPEALKGTWTSLPAYNAALRHLTGTDVKSINR